MWSSMRRRRTGRVKWDPKQVGRLIGKSQCGTRSHRPSVSWHVDSDVHRFHRWIPCMHSRILPVSQFWMLIGQLERDLPVTRQVAFAVHLLGIRNVATCSILISRSATNTCIRRKRHPANRQTAPISSTHPWHLSWKKYMEAGPASWVGILSNHDAGSVVSDGYPLDRYILFYSPYMQNCIRDVSLSDKPNASRSFSLALSSPNLPPDLKRPASETETRTIWRGGRDTIPSPRLLDFSGDQP